MVQVLSEKIRPVVAWEVVVEEVRGCFRGECHGLVREGEGEVVGPRGGQMARIYSEERVIVENTQAHRGGVSSVHGRVSFNGDASEFNIKPQ